uniref:Carbamoyltransferase C-terminal domain-containing protein n=1 Tax=Pyrodinium bahamense TaxID=73915 RepID=A0A7S0AYJ0_9DINO
MAVLAPGGRVLANHEYVDRLEHSYRPLLEEFFGEAIPEEKFWNPDKILCVDDVQISEFTRQRCDKAAAMQLVFEDWVAHVLRYLIEKTGSNHLVWSGGCALNCRASLTLLEHFNQDFYRRLDQGTGREERTLHIWVPPTPNDAGGPAGAAFALAFQAWPQPEVVGSSGGAGLGVPSLPPAWPLPHAFLCGQGPSLAEVDQALKGHSDVKSMRLELGEDDLADFMAYVISHDGVMGIFQGAAEIGPRALGHRTILANPVNPQTLEVLNSRVKLRERVRPIAPMVTLEAAQAMWHLEPGASDSSYDAYRYMVQCVRAKPLAQEKVPAVVHVDGTSRIQLVRESDGLVHKYLKRMGVRCGVEVSVNTSLNVGSPIVQTPEQAIGSLLKSAGMHAILLVADNGIPTLVYGTADDGKLKDGGRQLLQWLDEWRGQSRGG